jgi:hypothetical protein
MKQAPELDRLLRESGVESDYGQDTHVCNNSADKPKSGGPVDVGCWSECGARSQSRPIWLHIADVAREPVCNSTRIWHEIGVHNRRPDTFYGLDDGLGCRE